MLVCIALPSRSFSSTIHLLKTQGTQQKSSFGAVYADYKDVLYTYVLFRVGHDRDSAEDIVSDVFLKAYRNYEKYDPQYKLSTWLFSITRNTLIDHYRKGRTVVDIDSIDIQDDTDELYQLLTREISYDSLNKAIASLPDIQKECIQKQFFEGKTAKEVGEELHISHEATRKHVSRGVAALRTALLSITLMFNEIIKSIV